MFIDFMLETFAVNRHDDAIIWKGRGYSYQWLLDRIRHWQAEIRAQGIAPGTVTTLEADFSPNAIALFLALVQDACIVVPLTSSVEAEKRQRRQIAQAEVSFVIDPDDRVQPRPTGQTASHDLYRELRRRGHPGLVIFTSGSTGNSKAVVHDLVPILQRFAKPARPFRGITFMFYDHIAGVNTLFRLLASGGCMVTVQERTPDTVLSAVEEHRVGLLPVTPTFVNLLLISEAYKRHDLSSLEILSYGSEPMPQSTLRRIHELLPNTRLVQLYGLSEVGILRSKPKSSDSLWIKVGGEGLATRVVDGMLQVKVSTTMLGYLNATAPFTEDGWYKTGDAVEVDGDYIRVLGRKSELINVGGEKVYPAEVESVVQELDNVRDVTIHGEKNPITGQIVCAKVTLIEDEDQQAFARRLKRFCGERLEPYKVPVKVRLVAGQLHSERFKKRK